MLRFGFLGGYVLCVVACSDDGHVVGEMSEGGAGNGTITATNAGGTASTDGGGSGGAASHGTSNGTSTGSGGAGAGAGATDGAAQSSTGAGGSGVGGGVGGSGGSAGADASSGGSSGASGETSTSTTSSDPCAPGATWCPGCNPGEGTCVVGGGCPGYNCPTCTDITTLEECELEAGCHAVFEDPNTCGCAAIGCCARFKSCAEGNADCEGPAMCEVVTPFCEGPAFVVSYANSCYEGCVRAEACPN